jgi:hypothetical protein
MPVLSLPKMPLVQHQGYDNQSGKRSKAQDEVVPCQSSTQVTIGVTKFCCGLDLEISKPPVLIYYGNNRLSVTGSARRRQIRNPRRGVIRGHGERGQSQIAIRTQNVSHRQMPHPQSSLSVVMNARSRVNFP